MLTLHEISYLRWIFSKSDNILETKIPKSKKKIIKKCKTKMEQFPNTVAYVLSEKIISKLSD